MAISAAMVKELRESTGAGMMDAKKALEETSGDMEAAVDWLRTKGLAKAAKKSGRIAAEGLVAVAVQDGKGVAVEVNSETDFVGKNAEFQGMVRDIAQVALSVDSTEALAAVGGLDGLFIGPGDLGLSLGLGAGQDRDEPEMRDAFARVHAACRRAGKRTAIHAASAGYAARMARSGFDLVTVWVDAAAIASTLGTVAEVWAEQAPGTPRQGT